MKLILTAEVDHLGTTGDTVEVKDGYGRNYLLPRGLGTGPAPAHPAQAHAPAPAATPPPDPQD